MTQISLKVTVVLVTIFCVSSTQTNGEQSEESDGPCSPFQQVINECLDSSSDALQQFNVAMPPYLAGKLFYKFALPFYAALKAPNIKDIAQCIANAAQYRVECISPKQFADFCSHSMEHILDVTGVLTNENAASLAEKYLKYLEHTRKSHGFKGTPESNLKSLYNANVNFIKDSVHCNENTGEIVAKAYEKHLNYLPCCCAVADD